MVEEYFRVYKIRQIFALKWPNFMLFEIVKECGAEKNG